MSTTIPAKPASDEATKKSLIDAVIDALAVHDALLERASQDGDNGSFEIYITGENTPVLWTRTLLQNGAGAKEETVVAHGLKSYKFTRMAGSGNGGGYLESSQYISIGELESTVLRCFYKATAAIKSKIEIIYYNAALSVLSTVVAATIQVATDWRVLYHEGSTPGGARYAKIRLTGGTTDVDSAGSAYFDGFTVSFTPAIIPALPGLEYLRNGTYYKVYEMVVPVPATATTLAVTAKLKAPSGEAKFKAKVGSIYGTEQTTTSDTYVPKTSAVTLDAANKGTFATVELWIENLGAIPNYAYLLAESDFSGGFEAKISIT